ncbi:hypothetical protein Efla_004986 [Eimeria flavescens]
MTAGGAMEGPRLHQLLASSWQGLARLAAVQLATSSTQKKREEARQLLSRTQKQTVRGAPPARGAPRGEATERPSGRWDRPPPARSIGPRVEEEAEAANGQQLASGSVQPEGSWPRQALAFGDPIPGSSDPGIGSSRTAADKQQHDCNREAAAAGVLQGIPCSKAAAGGLQQRASTTNTAVAASSSRQQQQTAAAAAGSSRTTAAAESSRRHQQHDNSSGQQQQTAAAVSSSRQQQQTAAADSSTDSSSSREQQIDWRRRPREKKFERGIGG